MIETTVSANTLFCHQEFLEKLDSNRSSSIGKRASLLMQHLAIDSRRQHYKSTSGANKGWRRSRLGGNNGSHFYAWWAPASALPLRKAAGFEDAPEGSIVLRDIRHHDDHSPVTPQDLQQHYLPVGVNEIRQDDFGPSPWTPGQAKFAAPRGGRVRLLKGHPGSGKTTALLHAADTTGADKSLYVTYSRDLAILAREYFDRYCAKARQFHVFTYPAFIREISGSVADIIPLAESRRRFQSDIGNYARSLGPWTGQTDALYDEMHAHLVGAALPIRIGRFEDCQAPRSSDRNYRTRRLRFIGESAVNSALDIAVRLEKTDAAHPLAERYFPELWQAWHSTQKIMAGAFNLPAVLQGVGCVAVDECQDLTALEAFVLGMLSSLTKPALLIAGDEAQTVRPTDFEWGWFNDILHGLASSPVEYKLTSNLRSPRRLAMIVNRVWDLYATLDKRDRPSGAGYAEIEDDATDQLFYCSASPGGELNELLRNLSQRGGLALISLGAVPDAVPEDIRGSVLTASEVKGLDFHSVCILNGGDQLQRITDRGRAFTQDVEALRRRLAIDQLRVALSRPTERLIWLDIAPKPAAIQASLDFLNGSEASAVTQSVPGAVLKALDEEELDLEERIQRCLHDARQLLDIKPDLAWSRAMLAVMLLGSGSEPTHITDAALRESVHLTAAEISFTLAARGIKLSATLGNVDLFLEAGRQCHRANKPQLRSIISAVELIFKSPIEQRPDAIYRLAQQVSFGKVEKTEVPPWLLAAIQPRLKSWVEQIESAAMVGNNASLLYPVLLPFYEAMRMPDAVQRANSLRERTLQTLLKAKRFEDALALIRTVNRKDLPANAADRKLEATCLEKMGSFLEAARLYEDSGDAESAVDCYRQVPDIEAAYRLMLRLPKNHSARESYEWMVQVREVFGKRPANFNRVMLGPEKKALETLLEQGLGVQRKAAAKKAATKKRAAVPRTRSPF